MNALQFFNDWIFPALLGGIFGPLLVVWVKKRQKRWKHKIIDELREEEDIGKPA